MKENLGNSEAELMGGGGLDVTCSLSYWDLVSTQIHNGSMNKFRTPSSLG